MFKKLFLGFASLFLISATPDYAPMLEQHIPPAEFQAYGATNIIIVSPVEIAKYCGGLSAKDEESGKVLLGCTKFNFVGNTIIVPDPCPLAEQELYALILCHEAAHALGGWSSRHEPSR